MLSDKYHDQKELLRVPTVVRLRSPTSVCLFLAPPLVEPAVRVTEALSGDPVCPRAVPCPTSGLLTCILFQQPSEIKTAGLIALLRK